MAKQPETPRPIGYGRQTIGLEDVEGVVRVLGSERLTQGAAVEGFEGRLSAFTGARHAVAVSNGTVALELAYLALDVGPGTRVATTANTFLATATTAVRLGAEVEFVDVEPESGNLDVEELAALCAGPNPPDVVTVVHFAGLPCDMQSVLALKRTHGFRLVEDAAHALGATYRADGRSWRVGEHPDVDATTLSFHPVKLITTGEGGAVLTHHEEVAARVGRLREHGVDRRVEGLSYAPMVELGTNGRLNDLSAALGISQLGRAPEFLAARRDIARRYLEQLEDYLLPSSGTQETHAWHLFFVRVEADERDALRAHLRGQEIHTQVHYHPVPLQPWFLAHTKGGHWPNAEAHGKCALSLPIHPSMEEGDQARVLDALRDWRRARRAA